jgi:hypothetical protein
VDTAAARFYRIIDFHRVIHVGGVSGKRLFHWQLHLAALFAGPVWPFAPYSFFNAPRLVTMILSFTFFAFCSARNVGGEVR